jgi:hypothetical protein
VALIETGTAEAKTQAAEALSTMVVANPDNHSTVAQNLVAMLSQDTSSNEAQLSLTLASSWVGQIALKPAQHRVQVIATFPNTVINGTRSI